MVDEALTSEQVWAQLVQQNRVARAFWKPYAARMRKAEGEAVLIVPRVVEQFADDFAADLNLDEDEQEGDGVDDDGDDDGGDVGLDDDQGLFGDDDGGDDDDDDDDGDDDDGDGDGDDHGDDEDEFFDFDDMEAFADEAEAEAEAQDDDADGELAEQHLAKQPAKRAKRAERNPDGDELDMNDDDDDDGDEEDDEEEEEEDDIEEEEVDLMAEAQSARELKEAAKLKYSDFFGDEKPRKSKKQPSRDVGGDDDDDNDVDDKREAGEEDDEFFELHEYQRIDKSNREQARASGDEDADVLPNDPTSPFERAQRNVTAKIAKMEAALVAERPWALRGEVGAKARPANSLIETEVEYDHATRPAPVITEEHTQTLEDMIRARVRDAAYDDVQRRTEADIEAKKRQKRELPEISHEKSKLSLAEVYAADYVAEREQAAQARLGDDGVDPEALETVGDELDEQRKEIRQLFEALCARLDALSHYRARPRLYIEDEAAAHAKAAANVPAARLEHALPVALSQGDALAPEERYAVKRQAASDVVQRAAGAERRARKNAHAVKSKRDPAPPKELSEREARAAALKQVSQHSNVTVVPKKGKKDDTGVDSERGSSALFKQLQREVSGEIASSKQSKAAASAAAAALSTKRSGKASSFKL